jgi:hypothetical protein
VGRAARQAHGLRRSEHDDPGHEQRAAAQRQPGAETEQRAGAETGDRLAMEWPSAKRGDCERDGDEQRAGRSR